MKKRFSLVALIFLVSSISFSQIYSYDIFENDSVFHASIDSAKISTEINQNTGEYLNEININVPGKIEISRTHIIISGTMNRWFKVIRVTSDQFGFLFLVHDEANNKFYHLSFGFSENWQADHVLITITGCLDEWITLDGHLH